MNDRRDPELRVRSGEQTEPREKTGGVAGVDARQFDPLLPAADGRRRLDGGSITLGLGFERL
jgi:hypothetical protein